MARHLALVAPAAISLAAVVVLVAGWMTPGYDPIVRTVSRLAVPGMPAAAAVDVAIALAGLSCFLLAGARRRGRLLLMLAGSGFLGAALVHLDPTSDMSTMGHRVASGVAVVGLVGAGLRVGLDYGRLSFALCMGEVVTLMAAPALLATSFAAWGAWERVLFLFALAWIFVVALNIVSVDETASATSAAAKSAARYTPLSNVTRANT